MKKKYPGINGIGIIYHVPLDERVAFEAKAGEEQPDFKIYPEHNNNVLLPITYITPVETNYKAIGLDMAHEQNRFQAAQRAMRTGEASITGPIVLVQDAFKTPGFLFYTPFYDKGQYKADSFEDGFVGMVYAPFIFNKLIDGTLSKANRDLAFRVTDDDTVLYSELDQAASGREEFSKEISRSVYGRTWAFNIRPTESFFQTRKSDKPIMILMMGLIIDALLIFVFLIITRQKQMAEGVADSALESLKESNEALRETNAELEEFAYRTSHDLRSPLVSAISLLGLAETSISDKKSDDAIEAIKHASKSLKNLEGLTIDILNLAEAKSAKTKETVFNAEKTIADSIDALKHMKDRDSIQLISDVQVVDLRTDEKQFRLIVENLISNAIKYSDHNEEAPTVRVSGQADGSHYIFTVEDNGLGIPENRRDEVFGMFNRFHSNISYGSGLGLYMVQKTADRMGAEIRYTPLDKGSRFEVILKDIVVE